MASKPPKSKALANHEPNNPSKHAIHQFHLFVERAPEDHFCQCCGVQVPKEGLCLRDSRKSADSKEIYCVNCLVCPQKHLLKPRYHLAMIAQGTYANNIFGCDCCSRETKVDTFVMSCPACEFDLCPECVLIHSELPGF
jgi:hypothetical protein